MTGVPTRALNNGVEIPMLGFGVFQIPPDEVVAPVATALEAGYRLIDTAAVYGNEEGVGKALADSGIARDELFVTTKVWNEDQGFDATLRAFDTSLDKLGLDTVDLYLIHWPSPRRGLYVESWKALERIYAEGRARAIGVSNFTVAHLQRLFDETGVVPATNQVELHPELPQDELRAFHDEHGIVTEAWSPIGAGKGLLENPAVVDVATRLGRTPAQAVLRWHVQRGTVVIPKSVTPERIRSNFEVFDFELGEADMAAISGLASGRRLGPDPETATF
ncbi:aldo/keto reductase [Motilibacter deserti]|uniref:Aldo/keto reductase n=1 Tax=Motilibacter deserti TaxID=2714956 RepID=A0ABX0GVR9_9ACTN|nr:aldo/keto reductase [Motilibacter deserti]NHC13727.1 aldo/keto reductase [Motilibacter deserti]